jgi:serine protease
MICHYRFSTPLPYSPATSILCYSCQKQSYFFTESITPSASGIVGSEARAKMETLWMIRALQRQPDIQYAEPNFIRKALIVEPNDRYYPYQWHYPRIRLPEAWEITTGSDDVVVAVMDTGALLLHPDLNGQFIDGYDFISDPDISLDGDGVDANPEDPGDGNIGGSSFRGTHVAGTTAALSNNNIGVAGVAWHARIMPLRVLGYGGTGTSSDILEAVKYAAGLEIDAGVQLDRPVDIINLSLGGSGYSHIEEAIYEEVRDQGVIIIAAAGNDGNNNPMYPAGYDSVVSKKCAGDSSPFMSYEKGIIKVQHTKVTARIAHMQIMVIGNAFCFSIESLLLIQYSHQKLVLPMLCPMP